MALMVDKLKARREFIEKDALAARDFASLLTAGS